MLRLDYLSRLNLWLDNSRFYESGLFDQLGSGYFLSRGHDYGKVSVPNGGWFLFVNNSLLSSSCKKLFILVKYSIVCHAKQRSIVISVILRSHRPYIIVRSLRKNDSYLFTVNVWICGQLSLLNYFFDDLILMSNCSKTCPEWSNAFCMTDK